MDELNYQIDLLTAINQKLCDSERMYRLICDTSNSAYIFMNFKQNRTEIIGQFDKYFPFQINDVRDFSRIFDYVSDKYSSKLREIIFLEKTGQKFDSFEYCSNIGLNWYECIVCVFYDEAGIPLEKIIEFKNITKFKKQNDELEYMAYYDALTGLYNRNYFVGILNEWIRRAVIDNAVIGVMFIDIDDFRKINDSLGLVVGDELVQVFGQFLNEFKSENVIVSHFSSDIFCMAIYEPCGLRSIENICKRIHERVQKPFVLTSRHELAITVCIGVAEYPEAAKTSIELINCAEIVMFKAKAAGSDGVQYFDAPIIDEFLQNMAIEHKLKEAALSKNFELYYQPQFDSKNNHLRGVEALIRWKDHDGNMISPSIFIPIAEKNGTIIPIGDWVLTESISTFAGWKQKFHYPLILSINISAIQYKRADFVQKLLFLLDKYHVDSKEIELEITESILIDDFTDVIAKMYMLRSHGIRVSLDDFGTGYSSLSYLKGLPIDTLKIDKSFIDTVASDDSTKIITESIISMVKKLGFETVAEGVETQEQFDYLKNIDCDNIQGFLLGKPMTSENIELLLLRNI